MENMKFYCMCMIVIYFGLSLIVSGLPVADTSKQNTTTILNTVPNLDGIDPSGENSSETNGTHKDLYVIKAVVYEIGILTEVPDDYNSTEDEDFSRERVDLTFFDAHSNGSYFNLGDIPLPIQTNVSGQVLTGIAPIHVGAINDANIFSALPITGTIVNISHSDTSFIALSHSPTINENGTILDAADLAKLPGMSGGSQPILIDNTPVEIPKNSDKPANYL